MRMGSGFLVLLAVQAAILLPGNWATAQNFPNPFASILNGTCVAGQCGMGSCKQDSSSILGFSCDCKSGWRKLDPLGIFPYAPCIIPNCTVNFSCSNATGSPSPPPPPPPITSPLSFDSCLLNPCQEGDCVSTSFATFRCDCRPGYSNLLNASFLPCVKECFLGADCAPLDLTPPNAQSPPPVVDSRSRDPRQISPPVDLSPPPVSGSPKRATFKSPEGIAWIIMLYSIILLALKT